MNLETGLKEARLNVPFPEGDESGTELAAVPVVDEDVVDDEPPRRSLVEQSGKVPPAYSNEGKIQQPPAASGESGIFTTSVSTILSPISSAEVIDAALDKLEDLAHEIYWGVEIAKDEAIVRKLVSLLEGETSPSKAALVLGSAVQNNAVALTAALSHFSTGHGANDPIRLVLHRLYRSPDPKLAERLLYLLSAIMRGGVGQRDQFVVKYKALRNLILVFKAGEAGTDRRDGVRGRIALLLMDNFFNNEMKDGHSEAGEPSQLTGEEPFIMAGPDTEQMILGKRIDTHEDIRPWCEAFATALETWDKQGKEKTAVAYARVDEAYQALRKGLSRQNISC